MPFIRIGNTIYKRVNGVLKKHARAKSIDKAVAMLRILKDWEKKNREK